MKRLILQSVGAWNLPNSFGPPAAIIPLWKSAFEKLKMGIFPTYFHIEHML